MGAGFLVAAFLSRLSWGLFLQDFEELILQVEVLLQRLRFRHPQAHRIGVIMGTGGNCEFLQRHL